MSIKSSYGNHETLLFTRGFLCYPANESPTILTRLGWHTVPLQGWNIAHAPNVAVATATNSGSAFAMIGWASSNDLQTTDTTEIVDWLCEVHRNETQYQARVDSLLGRFLVLRASEGRLNVQQDAFALRAAFFTDSTYIPVVGSHAHLVGECVGAPLSAWAEKGYTKATNIRAAPGRTTVRAGVLALTPNLELELSQRHVKRIFPVAPRIPANNIADLLPTVIQEAQGHLANLIATGRPIAASLSAGYDSRLTLALAREHASRMTWFTYQFPEKPTTAADEHDAGAAVSLAQLTGIPHTIIQPSEDAAPQTFTAVMGANRFRAHSIPLAATYQSIFSDTTIHLRSSGFGVASSYYRANGFPNDRVDPLYRMQLASWFKCHNLHVLDAFGDMSRATHFSSIHSFGYDELDFHLWEYREGVWLQNTIAESDPSSETGLLLGSRRLVSHLLSLPQPTRASHKHFLWMIRECWPELLDVPINGIPYASTSIDNIDWQEESVRVRKRPPAPTWA